MELPYTNRMDRIWIIESPCMVHDYIAYISQ